MKRNWKKTKFTKKIRIQPLNLLWLMSNKKNRTAAGFLDEILEEFKKKK